MSEWTEKRLGEMIDINPLVKLKKGGVYPFIDIDKVEKQYKNVSNMKERFFGGQSGARFQTGDTIFARITPCLENRKIAQVKLSGSDIGFGSTEFFVFRNKEGRTDPDFVYYFVSSDWVVLPAINSMTGASGRQRADRHFVERLKIKFPPLSAQTRIAEILSAYDDAIENNNHRIEILESTAREIYKEWFVRFRFPGHEKTKFVNGLPTGWEVVLMGSIINITSSKRSYDSERVETGIPLYRSKEIIQIKNGEAITEPLFISEEWYSMVREKFGVPQENDILITSRGTIGISFLVDKRVFYFSDGNLSWFQSCKKPELALYIYLWLNSPHGQSAALSSTIGTSQSALPIEKLKRLKILKPDKTVLSAFYDKVMTLVEQKRALQAKSQNLAKQRDMLLPRLMSRKMEV
jgi:type I restriction enzyme S subunit